MITMKDVSKSYSGMPALDSITLTLEEGRTHVILGASGCGKSTWLRILIGLIVPDHGQVTIAGETLTPANQARLAEKIGYVIQEGGLFPHLTAERNVALKARLLGWPMERISARMTELTSLVGLSEPMLRRYPRELSGGQRQRVSLMRALMLDPPILLMDEPLGALDPIVRRSLQDELREIFARMRKTVVLVTHDLSEAAFFGDTVTLLDRGQIAQRGSFADLYDRPATPFVREFVNAQRPLELFARAST